MPSVLQAASPLAREPWKPRPGDGISSTWLIAELTHRQAHGLDSQIPMEADRGPRAGTHVPLRQFIKGRSTPIGRRGMIKNHNFWHT